MKSLGTLDFTAGDPTGQFLWKDLRPDVAIRAKHIFRQIRTARLGVLEVSATDSVCVDVEWFLQRYNLSLTSSARRRIHQGCASAARLERDLGEITAPGWTPPAQTGFREGRAPYPYQAAAAAVAQRTGSLLLMDDVGLGKTVSALAVLAGGGPLPAAIVVQAHLAEQWVEDFIEPFTHLRAHIIKSRTPYQLPEADVYIFRYSNVGGWTSVINTGRFRTVIYDEMQEVRHGRKTQKGQACGLLADGAEMRIGLTATPIYNHGDEILSLVDMISPGLLGTRDEFLREWCGWEAKVKDPVALGHHLRETGIVLRRTEAEVDDQRPPLNKIVHEIAWDPSGAQASLELARSLAGRLLSSSSFVEKGQAARELDIHLRQATGVAKAPAVAAYVRMLLESREKVLVAVWHRDVYESLFERLQEFDVVRYSGSETAAKKRKNRAAFIDGTARVMLISLRSGAGLDGLQQVCSDIVFGEFDWSPQVHRQVIGRLRRPGQTETVNAHFLHTDNGSDPALIELLGLKRQQSDGIVDLGVEVVPETHDDSRMVRLAKMYLERAEEVEGQYDL